MNCWSMPQEAVDFIKLHGYRVYMRNRSDSYAIFENERGIGYVQFDPMAGYTVATIHAPNFRSGTGYQIDRHIPALYPAVLEQAVTFAVPPWALGDPTPKKYANMVEYRKEGKFDSEYKQI